MDRRGVLLLVACIAGGWAVIANSWYSAGANSVGLFGVQLCSGWCELETWQTLHAPYELLVLGGSTFLGVAHTIGFAVHAVIVVRKQQPARVKVRWTIATAVATLAAGVAFLVRAPRLLPGVTMTVSYAPFLAFAATAALAVLTVRLRATSSS